MESTSLRKRNAQPAPGTGGSHKGADVCIRSYFARETWLNSRGHATHRQDHQADSRRHGSMSGSSYLVLLFLSAVAVIIYRVSTCRTVCLDHSLSETSWVVIESDRGNRTSRGVYWHGGSPRRAQIRQHYCRHTQTGRRRSCIQGERATATL